eukprot:90130_1
MATQTYYSHSRTYVDEHGSISEYPNGMSEEEVAEFCNRRLFQEVGDFHKPIQAVGKTSKERRRLEKEFALTQILRRLNRGLVTFVHKEYARRQTHLHAAFLGGALGFGIAVRRQLISHRRFRVHLPIRDMCGLAWGSGFRVPLWTSLRWSLVFATSSIIILEGAHAITRWRTSLRQDGNVAPIDVWTHFWPAGVLGGVLGAFGGSKSRTRNYRLRASCSNSGRFMLLAACLWFVFDGLSHASDYWRHRRYLRDMYREAWQSGYFMTDAFKSIQANPNIDTSGAEEYMGGLVRTYAPVIMGNRMLNDVEISKLELTGKLGLYEPFYKRPKQYTMPYR